jgi:hypothetical protein
LPLAHQAIVALDKHKAPVLTNVAILLEKEGLLDRSYPNNAEALMRESINIIKRYSFKK